jgi:GNAT superfamily N-acetyltransferase
MEDIQALTDLIRSSVRELQKGDYSAEQREAALGSVFGVDRRLIEDATYYVVECGEALAGCGGWSRRHTLFGSDHWHGREDSLLNPAQDAAKIRAFFVHPDFARRGVASMILDTCEAAAKEHGFTRLEMGATLTGVPFYLSPGICGGGTDGSGVAGRRAFANREDGQDSLSLRAAVSIAAWVVDSLLTKRPR